MRVAVIGAGIVGVTTAYELASAGHEVSVHERHAGVASEASFANAGVIAPGYVTPWAAPGMPAKLLLQAFSCHSALRFAGPSALRLLPWMWQWWRACSAPRWQANRGRMLRLAQYSLQRLQRLSSELDLDFERGRGYLVLLRGRRELAAAQPGMQLLRDAGVAFELVGAPHCRELEPGLNPDTPLHGGIHLPQDEVGNCRQFAQLLRAEAQRLGASFHFQQQVLSIEPGTRPRLHWRQAGGQGELQADAVVVCAGHAAGTLLQGLGLKLPLAPVYGYSITAALRERGDGQLSAARSALMDERYKVAISRLGQRLRVAGGAELGGSLEHMNPRALGTLRKVLNDWFPGSTQQAAQAWKGARPMLPDGPPVLGASGAPGVWLNLGHGSSGWALACGSARVLADQVAGRAPEIDTEGLDIARLA